MATTKEYELFKAHLKTLNLSPMGIRTKNQTVVQGDGLLMDRNEYLKAMPKRWRDMKKAKCPASLLVTFDGVTYLPNAYEMAFDSKGQSASQGDTARFKSKLKNICKNGRVKQNG